MYSPSFTSHWFDPLPSPHPPPPHPTLEFANCKQNDVCSFLALRKIKHTYCCNHSLFYWLHYFAAKSESAARVLYNYGEATSSNGGLVDIKIITATKFKNTFKVLLFSYVFNIIFF